MGSEVVHRKWTPRGAPLGTLRSTQLPRRFAVNTFEEKKSALGLRLPRGGNCRHLGGVQGVVLAVNLEHWFVAPDYPGAVALFFRSKVFVKIRTRETNRKRFEDLVTPTCQENE